MKFVARIFLMALLLSACSSMQNVSKEGPRTWLAGDHHIHSEYSVGWEETDPPKPIIGGDAIYSISRNAEMARKFGLAWMVATDHGGPNHSKINLETAYPEMLAAREVVPEVMLFAGLELNTPAADHSSIIVPHTHDEAEKLYQYESRFDKRDAWPADESRDRESLMLEALEYVDKWDVKPVVIAHHPSRSASGLGEYGETTPAELRQWNNVAPDVAVGMEGAPGHQAARFTTSKHRGIYPAWVFARGAYGRGFPTLGGFDQMTAIVGGFWDSMLSEGRRWWITANSDSHIHYSEGGVDFWPGEYSKTYVLANRNHADVIDGIRKGRVFVTTGDLVSELFVTVSAGDQDAGIGGELVVDANDTVMVEIGFREPATPNAAGDKPAVERVDLVVGEVSSGRYDDLTIDRTTGTHVVQRFTDWASDGDMQMIRFRLDITTPVYLRVRGTNNKAELEPLADEVGEDPWQDLWFYSNPVFINVRG
jgi:hypothetical protein